MPILEIYKKHALKHCPFCLGVTNNLDEYLRLQLVQTVGNIWDPGKPFFKCGKSPGCSYGLLKFLNPGSVAIFM